MAIDNNPLNSPQNKSDGPPSGRFVTVGIMNGEDARHTGTTGPGGQILGGDLVVNLVTRDPYTGQTALFDSVKVKTGLGSLVTGISPGCVFDVYCPCYDAFKRRDVTGMVAIPASTEHIVQNQSLPEQVKVKDSIDNFANSPGSVCKKYNEHVQAAQRHLGLTHGRDDLQIVQGRENGRSPGLVVNQRQGYISLFGIDGKQNMNISHGSGVEMKTASINTGNATLESTTMQYGGMPQMNNPVNNVIPQGTIVSPQPQTIPQILKILNMVGTIVDMIDLVNACREAVTVIRNMKDLDQEQALDEIRKDAEGPGSFEKAYYGNEQKAEEAAQKMSQQNRS